MKKLIILASLILINVFSCQKDETLDKVSPIKSDIKTERLNSDDSDERVDDPDDIIRYLRENRFVLDADNKMTAKIKEKQKIKTLKEAKKIVEFIKNFGKYKNELHLSSLGEKNGRVTRLNCDDSGIYYISNAIDGFFGGG